MSQREACRISLTSPLCSGLAPCLACSLRSSVAPCPPPSWLCSRKAALKPQPSPPYRAPACIIWASPLADVTSSPPVGTHLPPTAFESPGLIPGGSHTLCGTQGARQGGQQPQPASCPCSSQWDGLGKSLNLLKPCSHSCKMGIH